MDFFFLGQLYKKIKFQHLLVLLFLASSFPAQASGTLQGSVHDHRTGEPLIGANIVISGTGLGAFTGENGQYIIYDIPSGMQTIKVSYIGFRSQQAKIKIHPVDRIRGKVLDTTTGEPLRNIQVTIKGSTISSTTNFDGQYFFENMPPGTYTVEVFTPGYQPLETAAYVGVTQADFELYEDAIQAEELIVTGITARTSKSNAGISVTNLETDALAAITAPSTTADLTTARIPGVQVQKSSGNVGAGYRFFMRSGGGLNGDEQPVIYLDGIRIDPSEVNGFPVGGQGNGLLADINPEEIADIQVLKGPAAATAYGSHGGHGVILVTTKRGSRGYDEPPGLKANYKFLTGWNAQSSTYSTRDILSASDANALFRNGTIIQNSLNLHGSSPLVNYFVSFGNRIEDGILTTDRMNRKTVRGNFDFLPKSFLAIAISSSYTQNKLQRPLNDDALFGYLYNTTVNPQSFSQVGGDASLLNRIDDENVINRFIASAKADFHPTDFLSARLLLGMDDHDLRQEQKHPASAAYSDSAFRAGVQNLFNRKNRQLTANLSGRWQTRPGSELGLSLVAGMELIERRTKVFTNGKTAVPTPRAPIVQENMLASIPEDALIHQREAGIFAEGSLTYRDIYSASLSVRRDEATAFGDQVGGVYYPGLNLSWRFDNYKWLPEFLTLLKLRTAYGETGILPKPLDGLRIIYGTESGGYGAGAVPQFIGNPKLKPERAKEIEVGFDVEILYNYVFEMTYYRQNTDDTILYRRLPPSTGLSASAAPANIGATEGWGIETLLHGRVARSENWGFSFTLISSWQKNEVTELGGTLPVYDAFGMNAFVQGFPRHEFYVRPVLGAALNDNGTYAGPEVGASPRSFGNPIPEQTGSLSVNLRFMGNFSFDVLADWALGHQIWNGNRPAALRAGNNLRYNELATVLALAGKPDFEGVAEQIEPVAGLSQYLPGTIEYDAAAKEFARLDPRYAANFIEDADFLKLRQISLSYDLSAILDMMPSGFFVKHASVTLAAANIWTATKYSGRDPETNWSGTSGLGRGQDLFTLQHPRTLNFALQIAF